MDVRGFYYFKFEEGGLVYVFGVKVELLYYVVYKLCLNIIFKFILMKFVWFILVVVYFFLYISMCLVYKNWGILFVMYGCLIILRK